VFVVGAVGRMVIGSDDSVEGFAQDLSQDLGATACADHKINHPLGNEGPREVVFTTIFPAGFVGVEVCTLGQGFTELFRNGGQFLTDTLQAVAHGAERQIETESRHGVIHDLDNSSSPYFVNRAEIGDGGVNAGTELGFGHLLGKLCSGFSTTGADQFVASVLRGTASV